MFNDLIGTNREVPAFLASHFSIDKIVKIASNKQL
jgi:hypothetical protein